jgi:hypothetical protein
VRAGIRPRRLILLAAAVVAYVLAAWAVVPGFFDGIAPPAPYRFVSPPPALRATNQPPLSGHATVRADAQGLTEPGNVYTQDSQASIAFLPGTFAAPTAGSSVTVDVTPQTAFPAPSGFRLATNVYCITASTALVAGKDPLVTLQYSSQVLAPSDVYEYAPGGTWQKIGSIGSAAPYYIAARATTLGCFGAGYVPGTTSPSGAGTSLPIIAGLAVAVVVLAAVPLLVLRRRGMYEDGEADDER